MQTFTDPSEFPRLSNTSATIGNFDGVHLGHQRLLDSLAEVSQNTNSRSCAITFEPHPLQFFHKAPERPFVLSSIAEKVSLLEQRSLDFLLVLPFERVASLTPAEFVERYLIKALNISFLLVGYDFSFGRDRAGSFQHLLDAGKQFGFDVDRFPPVLHDNEPISSSRIRQRLWDGDVAAAALLLNRPYSLSGTVIRGDARGRQLGFPTANVADEQTLLPNGVYCTQLSCRGRTHAAVTNIGTRPTFHGAAPVRLVETHVLDAGPNFNLYGQLVEVRFLEYLRRQETFASAEALVQQIGQDIDRSRQWFAAHT